MVKTLQQQYEENLEKMTQYCKENNLRIVIWEDDLHIFTANGSWKLTDHALFHKNDTRGYHVQQVLFDSLQDYLAYITDHDRFRQEHPFHKRKDANQSPHAFKPAQKYRKQTWRKSELRNIFSFMEAAKQYQLA